jgi:hypothetical protein
MHNYTYARLTDGQIERIRRLERELYREIGRNVTLIAFTPEEEPPAADCRSGITE